MTLGFRVTRITHLCQWPIVLRLMVSFLTNRSVISCWKKRFRTICTSRHPEARAGCQSWGKPSARGNRGRKSLRRPDPPICYNEEASL